MDAMNTADNRIAYIESLYTELFTLRSAAVANGDSADVAAIDEDRRELDRMWAAAVDPVAAIAA